MRKYIAEFMGTLLLVFLGTGTVVIAKGDTLAIGLAFGLAITIMAIAVGGVSGGNFNPAVTLAMVLNKRLALKDAVGYWISQFLGATVAAALIRYFGSMLGLAKDAMGQTDFTNISALDAFIVEIVITFIFVFVILMSTSAKYGNGNLAPFSIGLVLGFLIIVALNLTGGSLNPARSFGPAIFVGGDALKHYPVYLFAPLVGSALASIVAKVTGSEDPA